MIHYLRIINGKLQVQKMGFWHDVPEEVTEEPKKESHVHKHPHSTIDPCYCEEETKKEEKLNFIMDQQVAQATQNMKFCVNCNQEIPKPEVKRKKLAEIARSAFYSYESAPENPVDTFNRVASAVLADLEKRIEEFVRIESREYGEYKTVGDLRDFIRKEWLGE